MTLAGWKAGRRQEALDGRNRRHPDPALIQIGASAFFCGEEFVPHGVENHAGNEFSGPLQAQRHVVHGETMGEVGGSIQRIHVPTVLR